ncbi:MULTISPECIES: hypothetical protein [unclassified Mesorhizobium]|uniref:hypothetical protein n=1 Tax=unclassified Mesorhizobium TaxID=325217 RepID=UPI001128F62B|nr:MULTISPECIES: hypothetical protein [unclassified Mesorhizobium]TPK68645.1 hypothetical protein FJ551_02725 [Mesorhizobium sp. B2-5-1]TPM62890.1 hypothetical protein FJ962_11065 [Mesorhizobium sp. B2-1-9]TPM79790.1 hypothetical protein FJ963_27995 [Mesorhizobium sp. B2-1-4]TPN04349.1 hypothetical protein FJ971_30100 [Mesorhizobium sp. B2-1-2]UCI15416.1 hypothetical protein FJ972_11465 [Mesorhizobium sp. B2-1-1]
MAKPASSQRRPRAPLLAIFVVPPDLGSLILQAGRPVFVASTSQENFRINKILVGWKDRREAKRAVTDAVPLFQMAQEAGIITIEDAATDETWNSLNDASPSIRATA